MLQSIRDNTQGWIAGVIISILILSFALWGIHSYIGGGGATDVVAKVNGTDITKNQLSVAYERLRRQLQMQSNSTSGLPEGAEKALKTRALQALVNIQALKQASIEQNYRISETQVDNLLESMPEFQANGQFSLARFQQVLSSTLFSAGEFLDLLKTSLLIDQPRLGLLLTSFAMPNEVVNALALVNQERDIRYTIVSVHDLTNQVLDISENQIETYYKTHQDDFKNPEQVSVQYIELSLKDLLSTIHPSDDELKKFYTENSSSYAEPTQWKLEAILIPVPENASDKDILNAQNKMADIVQRVSKNENFHSFAHQYPVNGKLSEKLQGWITVNRLPQEFQKPVLALTKTGQISSLIKTEFGFVLLKASDIKQAKTQSYEQVKDKIKEAYILQQAEEKLANLKEKLANSTYEHPDSLEPAAQTLGLPINSTELFTKDKGSNDITKDAKVREAAFNNDVINLRNNSDVIQPTSDSAIVLRVKTHVDASLLPLATVKQQIIDKLKLQQAEQLTQKRAIEIKDKLMSGESVNQYNVSWTNAGFIGRHATKVDTAILNEAFSMPKPNNASKPVYSVVKVPNGYAVVALSSVKDGEPHNKREEYDLFAEQIQNSQGLLEYELYKDGIMKRSDITIENQQDTTTSLASQ